MAVLYWTYADPSLGALIYSTYTLGQSLLNKLDFGNALLVGFLAYLISRLQAVQNVSARLIQQLHHSSHVSDSLVSLHWLCFSEHIEYKIVVLVYIGLHDRLHVTVDCSPVSLIYKVIACCVPLAQTVFTFHLSGCPWSAPEPTLLPDLASGTMRTLHLLKLYIHSVTGLSCTCFSAHTFNIYF